VRTTSPLAAEYVPSAFGVQLRRLRLAAGLTQEMLAERSRVSVDAISTLESGRRRRPHPQTVVLLARGLDLGPEERERLTRLARRVRCAADAPAAPPAVLPAAPLPPHAPLPAGSQMPLAPNPLFVGRAAELVQIAEALTVGDPAAPGPIVASTGLGGLGKTQLAVEFVHRFGRFFAGGVFWLGFASADEVPLQVAACADPGALDLAPGLENLSLEERVQRVQRAWQDPSPRLLVFDNCEEEALLERWRPASGGCRVLLTSRRSRWSPTLGVVTLPLDPLPHEDGIELLRRYRPDLALDDPGLHAIAAELGDLPLALHLAGSYLRAYHADVSVPEYLAELRQPDAIRHASLLGAGLDDAPSPTHHVQSLAQTFALCLRRLDRERDVDRVGIALLARMACLAPGKPIPRDLLARTMEGVDPLLRADGLRRLAAVGLVDEGERWLRLHRLLVHFVRHEDPDPDARQAVDRALIESAEAVKQGQLIGHAVAELIPHLIDGLNRDVGDAARVARYCNAIGLTLQTLGYLLGARPWLERALEVREGATPPDPGDVAESLNNLGKLMWSLGELAAARPLLARALAIREGVLGADHPDTADSLNDLAGLLWALGHQRAGRSLLERSLRIREAVLGAGHRETARSLSNLGLVLMTQGELAAARPLLERSLAIRERVLGADHPDTAASLNNLAYLLRDQGELDRATSLCERALAIWERVMGPEHPDTAHSLQCLALLRWDRSELDAARSLCERALSIREQVLGPEHPHTAASLGHLAGVLRDQGDPAAAGSLLRRALAIRDRVVGPDHPDTVATRRALKELAARGRV
jgi:tetratricopeptide (TPR) repeat protein/DNA-binding XRE family transcriptional regulator